MSELRTNYPRAKAWTYVIDTPPSGTSAPGAARAEAAAAGRRRAGSREAGTRQKKKSSLGSSGGGSTNTRGGKVQGDSMGGLCSSSKNVDNKENAGDLEDAPFIAVGAMVPDATLVDAASGANLKATRVANKLAYADGGADREGRRLDPRLSDAAGDLLLMDATAFLSPDPEDSAGTRDVGAELGDDIGGEGEMYFEDEGGFLEEEGDRTAWLARNMGLLRGGSSVDVAQIKQVMDLFQLGFAPLGASAVCSLMNAARAERAEPRKRSPFASVSLFFPPLRWGLARQAASLLAFLPCLFAFVAHQQYIVPSGTRQVSLFYFTRERARSSTPL